MLNIFLQILIGFFLSLLPINAVGTYTTQSPLWIAHRHFRAGNLNFINFNFNAQKITTYSLIYSSNLSGIPRIAYGFKTHKAYDQRLTYNNFDLRKSIVSPSVLTLQFQLYNMKTYKIDVCYFAIDPALTQHINAFDNVDLNYTSGPLTTFNTQGGVTVTHTETINYTRQANALNFKTFSNPLSSNAIVVFQNSLYIQVSYYYSVSIAVSCIIINSTHYQLKVSLASYANIYRFRFSMIIFNKDDVQDSKEYQIIYQYLATNSQIYRALQPAFVDCFILGITDFSSSNYVGVSEFEWNWQYKTNNRAGVPFQVLIYANYWSHTGNYAFSSVRSHLVYIKTWWCNSTTHIYFNTTTNLCQNACSDYNYQNFNERWCDKCYYACQQCSIGSTNQNTCITCQTAIGRFFNNFSCVCSTGYFDDFYNPICRLCSSVDSNCIKCTYPYNSSRTSDDYKTFFNTTNWQVTILPSFTCNECKTNYFYNSTSRICGTCNIANCTLCLNLTACSICNAVALTIKYTDNKCYVCNISKCTLCSANNVCVQCQTGNDLIINQCTACNVSCTCGGFILPKISGICTTTCGDGFKVGNQQCDDSNNISHDGCSNLCKIEACNQSCSCDGWVAPWVTSNNSCSTRCGDGIKRGIQQCDDGNTRDHDNCSSICKFQPCHISCNCDGWTHPYLQNQKMCSSICGDGILRGSQQCDDQNLNNNDGCTFSCKNEKVFLKQGSTIVPSLIIFFISIRIAGIQVLNVLQNFQLLLRVYGVETFQISYFIHGFSNNNASIFKIDEKNYFLKRFNFMFILIGGLFLFAILIQCAAYYFTNKSKRKVANLIQLRLKDKKTKINAKQILQKQKNQNEQNDNQDISINQKHQSNQEQNQQQIQLPKNKVKPPKIRRFKKLRALLRQVLFDIIINCVNIFFFGIVNQIIYHDYNKLLQTGSLITILFMVLFLISPLVIMSQDYSLFGQNEFKFNQKKSIDYWFILISQKFFFSILINFKQNWVLVAMLAIKLSILLVFFCGSIYNSTVQAARCIMVHFIHFILLITFTLVQIYSNDNSQKVSSMINKSGYFYLTCIAILIILMVGCYIRQLIHLCAADFRIQQQEENYQFQSQQQQTEQKSINDIPQKQIQLSKVPQTQIKNQKTIMGKFKQMIMKMTGLNLIKDKNSNSQIQQNQNKIQTNHKIKNINIKNNNKKPKFKIQNREQSQYQQSIQQVSFNGHQEKQQKQNQLILRIKSSKIVKKFMNSTRRNNNEKSKTVISRKRTQTNINDNIKDQNIDISDFQI